MLLRTKKAKNSVKTAVICMTAALLCTSAGAQNASWAKEEGIALEQVTPQELEKEIAFLTDTLCKGRGTGTRGNTEAAFWIARQFDEAGLLKLDKTYAKKVYIRKDVIGRNIIGMIPGAVSMPRDRYIIVGAHYDHLGEISGKTYPGADSNASGTVALLSLMEMFSTMKSLGKVYDSNIIFVAFDAKEWSLSGSQEFWNMLDYGRLKDPLTGAAITPDKISLMVNIDQIGSTLSPIHKGREDYMIMLGTQSLKRSQRNFLTECNRSSGLNMDIGLDYYGSRNFTDVFYRLSDQRVFVDNDIPAVLFTSGITMNNNKTWDNVESLDMDVLHKRIRLIFCWLQKMLQS